MDSLIFVTIVIASIAHVNSRCDVSVLQTLENGHSCLRGNFSFTDTNGLSVESVALNLGRIITNLDNRSACSEFKSILVGCIVEKYYWSLRSSQYNTSSRMINLQAHLLDITNDVSNINQISDLLASRNQNPVLSTVVGESLEAEYIAYNESCHCWDVNIDEDSVKYLKYVVIELKNGIFLTGSLTARSLVLSPEANFRTIGNVSLRPSDDIKGKIFTSICSPHYSVLAAKSFLIFTRDAFKTFHKIKIPNSLSPSLEEKDHIVSMVKLTPDRIFILVQGKIYSSSTTIGEFNFILIHLINKKTQTEESIIGISASPVCYRGSVLLLENSMIYAWSSEAIFLITLSKDNDNLTVVQLDVGEMLSPDTGSRFVNVHQTINPENMLVSVGRPSSRDEYFRCHRNLCSQVNMQSDASMAGEKILNSANTTFLMWNARRVTQSSSGKEFSVTFESNINDIYFNTDKNAWIINTKDGKVFYGRLHIPAVVKLRSLGNSNNYVYHFLSYGDVRYVTWTESESGDVEITSEVYPVLSEVQKAIENVEDGVNQINFNPYSSPRNVMRLESVQDSFSLSLTILTTRYDGYTFEVHHDFQNLSLKQEITEEISTRYISANILLYARELTITLIADCNISPQYCKTGFGLIELVYLPTDDRTTASALMNSNSQVYLVNMACPGGLKLRIANTGDDNNCTLGDGMCHLKIDEENLVYLEFEVYKNNEYLFGIVDDLLLIELNNRTGFELHNLNLLKKNCYHCSHFFEVSSPSHLMLQTMKSACPCNADSENENRWVANISFAHAITPPNGQNIFVFSAQVLSESFCDLRMEFAIEIMQKPSLMFLPWEYIFMLVFVAITIISLCISYHNYIKHMRMNRKRLKITDSH
uniref:uncharacterized protein LOC120326300 n=1 Tax=Styela clava TaxID=7725 RepID=UPI00193943D1|nr:uncharacterized protein LOC120326300 [Styela clava]